MMASLCTHLGNLFTRASLCAVKYVLCSTYSVPKQNGIIKGVWKEKRETVKTGAYSKGNANSGAPPPSMSAPQASQ